MFTATISLLLMSSIVTVLIRASALLDQTLALVVLLALLAPLRRLVLAVIFFLVAFLLRLVYCLAIVLGWAVHGDQLQRLRLGRVDELVLGSCWHDDDVGGFDVLKNRLVLAYLEKG